jgi:hypothetical protein
VSPGATARRAVSATVTVSSDGHGDSVSESDTVAGGWHASATIGQIPQQIPSSYFEHRQRRGPPGPSHRPSQRCRGQLTPAAAAAAGRAQDTVTGLRRAGPTL